MSVWDELVGQRDVVASLTDAARAGALVTGADPLAAARAGMTQSWLFTGPPGAGHTVAARAFAAALVCDGVPDVVGCGDCASCHTVLTDTAADLRTIRPEGLSLGVKEIRATVRDAARAPTAGRWRILLLEDADRLTEAAANALLKALEEPPERTVFLLCAPSVDDVLPTIRSRCRVVRLQQPSVVDVTTALVAEGASAAVARTAALASQGHVDRARRLAFDVETAQRRTAVLGIPGRLGRVSDCLAAAADLVNTANADAEAANSERDATETDALKTALGVGATSSGARSRSARAAKGRSMVVRGAAGAVKDLEKAQKSRGRRTVLDSLDRALVDLAGFYRDVLLLQLGAAVDPVHPDHSDEAAWQASTATPEQTLQRLELLLTARQALADNPGLAPLLTVESLVLSLRSPAAR